MKTADISVRKHKDDGLWYWTITVESSGKMVYGKEGFVDEHLCKEDAQKALKYLR